MKTLDFETEDVQAIVDILIERKLLVSGVVTASKESELVIPYLLEFWDYDNSPYRKELSRLGNELSYTYFETAFGRIKKYWFPRRLYSLSRSINPFSSVGFLSATVFAIA